MATISRKNRVICNRDAGGILAAEPAAPELLGCGDDPGVAAADSPLKQSHVPQYPLRAAFPMRVRGLSNASAISLKDLC